MSTDDLKAMTFDDLYWLVEDGLPDRGDAVSKNRRIALEEMDSRFRALDEERAELLRRLSEMERENAELRARAEAAEQCLNDAWEATTP